MKQRPGPDCAYAYGLPDARGPADRGSRAKRVCFVLAAGSDPGADWPLAWSAHVDALADAGRPPTVAVLPADGVPPRGEALARATGADPGRIVVAPNPPVPSSKGIFGGDETRAYQLYEWLRNQAFDVVHLPTTGGLGMYCLDAKRQGLGFADTLFCVRAQPTSVMRRLQALQPLDRVELLTTDHMERRSLENADLVVAPNAGLLDALASEGVRLPRKRTYIQPDPVPYPVESVDAQAPDTLLFVGTLGHEGGLSEACAALTRLTAGSDGAAPPALKRVVFAGPGSPHIDGHAFIAQKAATWPFDWEVRHDPDAGGMAGLLGDPGVLPVFTSPGPDMPDWLPACLAAARPVLVRAAGGGEAVLGDDRAQATYDPRPAAFARRLREALTHPPHRVRADDPDGSQAWRAWHAAPAAPVPEAPTGRRKAAQPLVTVCVMHHERPALLEQALASVRRQTYRNLEVVVVDDGSASPETIAALDRLERELSESGWRLIRQENSYLGAARNTAAREARGEYLYFLDDDNVLTPEGIETFVQVAGRTGADIVTAFSDVFEGASPPGGDSAIARNIFTGDNIALGLFTNSFGDSNALVRRESFRELGGNSEDYGVGKDDQEFFARALLAGRKLALVPEPLYWARRSKQRLRHKHFAQHAGDLRVSRPYVQATPSELRNIVRLAQGLRLRSTRAAFGGSGSDDDAAAMRDTLTLASQHLADSPRLQGFASQAYNAQKAAFQKLIAFEVRIARLLGRLARAAARRGGS